MTPHSSLPPVLVVGAGFSGAVIARQIACQLGRRVVVIDKRPQVGGNAYDCLNEHGVLVHPFGPHIFHTNSVRVLEYLSQFTEWRFYEHRVRGLVEGQFIPLPFNLESMSMLWGETEATRLVKIIADEIGDERQVPILRLRESSSRDIRKIADFIYENVFLHYTNKQWGMAPDELDASVSARLPVRLSRDDRYFQDSYQFMPAKGYTPIFHRMLSHELIELHTNTNFADVRSELKPGHVVFTGPIDEYFGYCHGALPYRSLRFENRTTVSNSTIQSVAVENYPTPASAHAFTRSTEFRLLTGQTDIGSTTQVFEYPEPYDPNSNEAFYPIPRDDNREIYRRYRSIADKEAGVTFLGRLGDYSYYNMDQAVARALACFEKELAPKLRAAG